MIEKFRKFLANLFKTSDSGIAQSTKGQQALDDFAADVRQTDLGDATGKFDETTKPGEFKKQKEKIIDQEGNVEAEVFSYRPESFTETQMRTGVGGYSDEALTERYEELRRAGRLSDEGYDDAMSLEEFIIKERNITPEARAAELRDKGKIKSIEPKQTGATFEEAADEMVLTNQGPMTRKEFETLQAQDRNPLLGGITAGQKVRLVDDAESMLLTGKEHPFIRGLASSTNRDISDVKQLIVDKMNEAYPPGDPKRVTMQDDDMIGAYIETQNMMNKEEFVDELLEAANELPLKPTGNPMLDDQLAREQELIQKGGRINEELKEIRARTDEVKEQLETMGLDVSDVDFDIIKNSDDINAVKAEAKKLRAIMQTMMGGGMDDLVTSGNLEKAMESIGNQAKADMARGREMAETAITPGELETAIEKMEEVQKAYQEGARTGIYKSPFDTDRTLNAKGGRIGFKEGSGGPKITRRNFLGAMGAGLATLFMPRGAKEIAEVVAKGATKTPLTAEGMPVWFPSLVNKIRKEGKLVKADYKAVKEGEGYDFYEFTDPSLPNKKIYMTESKQDGSIEISGRGDEMQITELTFIPGEESIMVTEKGKKVSKNPNTFDAGEFMKGPGEGIGDYENFGAYDELRFGVDSWANLVKTSDQKLDEAAEQFRKSQTNPNPSVSGKDPTTGEEFAKGGRVGYNMGGVGTLFKRKAS